MDLRISAQRIEHRFPRAGGKSLLRSILFGRTSGFTALTDVSIDLRAGEILGIIGSNGAGKSTLIRVLAGIYPVQGGTLVRNGRIVPVIDLSAGLKPMLTMMENLKLLCALYGLTNRQTRERTASIIRFAGLEGREKTCIYQFSRGMEQRLVFSIALHCDPDVLLLDEIFSVGDVDFRSRSFSRIQDLIARGGSVILIGHDLTHMQEVADRVVWLEDGRVVSEGDPHKICKSYALSMSPKS